MGHESVVMTEKFKKKEKREREREREMAIMTSEAWLQECRLVFKPHFP